MLVVDKPGNYLTIQDRFDHDLPSVLGFLKEKYGKVFIVHRLDRETSGLICFALTAEAHRNLSMQFENRETEKLYWVIAEGRFRETTGSIEAPLEPNPLKGGTMRVGKSGKASRTDYEVLEQFKDYALVQANIRTGRMHQIRVHFEHIGHPLAVDPLYGRQSAFLLSFIKKKFKLGKYEEEERPLMTRTTLHSKLLRIKHPVTGEKMEFEGELPKDFNAVLNQLRKSVK